MKKGFFRNKRGEEVSEELLWIIGEILIVVLFAVGVFSYIDSLQKNTLLEKNYLSRDTALLINTMYAAPNNVDYVYGNKIVNISDYNFVFSQQSAKTVEKDIDGAQSVYYWYADDKFADSIIKGEARAPTTIKLCKSNGVISISDKSDCTSSTILTCPEIDTKILQGIKPKIILDPVFGGDDTGWASNDGQLSESEIVRTIAQNLQALDSTGVNFEFSSTRPLDHDLSQGESLTVEKRKQIQDLGNYDIWITISMGEGPEGTIGVTSIIPKYSQADKDSSLKARKLGCTISNALARDIGQITTISPPLQNKDNPLLSPSSGSLTLRLEIGNTQTPSTLVEKPDKIANSIYNALKEYYGIDQ